ncbi:MAG: hypothetical protein J5518_00700 [Lachnospiraceae bacterium]|nr:hypothetical protein [Lachnospiraceae bacterium]
MSVPPGELYEGTFTLKSVTDTLVTGHVYTSGMRLVCRTDYFEDVEKEIRYVFDPTGLEAGDVVKGDIQIVSSAGEYYIPFVFSIINTTIESSLGSVRNLFHFTNQAQLNWDEAVHMFYSPRFIQIFDGNDRIHLDKYLGFLNAPHSEQSVDAFLVAINKKQPMQFSLDRSVYEFRDVLENMRCEVTVHKSTWGYVHLELSTDGDFVRLEKETVTDLDFLGNDYRLVFYLDDTKLHEGNNYGRILLHGGTKDQTLTIVASKRKQTSPGRAKKREWNQLINRLMRKYLSFRLKLINVNAWTRESMKIVERLNAVDDKNPLSRLFQAQLLLVEERYNEANWILEHVVNDMNIHNTDPEVYCYYLYLTTLYRREEDYVNQISAQVNSIYEQKPKAFQILWTLLYLDEHLAGSDSAKLAAIEKQFHMNCFSPILYMEAYICYVNNPALLAKLTDFELQVLWLPVRNGRLDREVMSQLTYLAAKQKSITPQLMKVLFGAYSILPDPELATVICTLLIKEDKRDSVYFPWYVRGVEADARITKLYEYFIYSLPEGYAQALPKQVFMYFGYQNDLSPLHRARLYANLIAHKQELPELYESYTEQMMVFAREQIEQEKISRELAALYKDVLFAQNMRPDLANHLSKVIFAQELSVPEPDMKKVVILQEQFVEEQTYPVEDHMAYPLIYNDECTLFLENELGERKLVDKSRLQKLMNETLYIPLIKDYVNQNLLFTSYLVEGKRHYVTVDESNVERCRELVDSSAVKESYKRDIRSGLMHYYYDNDEGSTLDSFLEEMDAKVLDAKDRAELIHFYVLRSMYEEAYELMCIYGTDEINAKTCVKICARMVEQKDRLPDPMLVKMCYFAFRQGKYDSETLQYLVDNFDGLTKELRDLWKAAGQFDLDCYMLTEKLIIQMLYTRTTVGEKEQIFEHYLSIGASTRVELAYLSYSAFDYFAKERLTDDSIFEHLVDNYRLGEELNDACKLALLKYYAEEKHDHSERIKDMLRAFLKEYMHRNMYFRFFSAYITLLPELGAFEDKAIIEYRTNPGNRVMIHYILEEPDSEEDTYRTEEMRNMYGGVFSKDFVLFFGENLQYYITEEKGGREQLTVSDSVSISESSALESESRYSLLNDMVVSKTLQDDETLLKLMEEYVEADCFTTQIFNIL